MIRLAVVSPLGRASAENLRSNWLRQRVGGCRLYVAENGPGEGACDRIGFAPHRVVKSGQHQSLAKNAGLRAVRDEGWATHWTTFDDDDYYGPEYLAELVATFDDGHEVVGKSESFVRLSDGRLQLHAIHGANREVPTLQGPTIGSVLWDGMPEFQLTPWGEDHLWTVDAAKKCWATSRHGFCYQRYPEPAHRHAFPMDDRLLLGFGFGELFDVETEASFRDAVDGLVEYELKPAERPRVAASENPAFRRLRPGEWDPAVVDKRERRDLIPMATPAMDLIADNPMRPRP